MTDVQKPQQWTVESIRARGERVAWTVQSLRKVNQELFIEFEKILSEKREHTKDGSERMVAIKAAQRALALEMQKLTKAQATDVGGASPAGTIVAGPLVESVDLELQLNDVRARFDSLNSVVVSIRGEYASTQAMSDALRKRGVTEDEIGANMPKYEYAHALAGAWNDAFQKLPQSGPERAAAVQKLIGEAPELERYAAELETLRSLFSRPEVGQDATAQTKKEGQLNLRRDEKRPPPPEFPAVETPEDELASLKAAVGSQPVAPEPKAQAAAEGGRRRRRRTEAGDTPQGTAGTPPEVRPPTDESARSSGAEPDTTQPKKRGRAAPKERIADRALKATAAGIASGYRSVQSWRAGRKRSKNERLLNSDIVRNTQSKFDELANLTDRKGKNVWSTKDIEDLKLAVARRGEFKPEEWWKLAPALLDRDSRLLKKALLHFRRKDVAAERARMASARKALNDAAEARRKQQARDAKVGIGSQKLTREMRDELDAAVSEGRIVGGIAFTAADRDKYYLMRGSWFKGIAWSAADRIFIRRIEEILGPVVDAELTARSDTAVDESNRRVRATAAGIRARMRRKVVTPGSPPSTLPAGPMAPRTGLNDFERRFIMSEIRANKTPGVTFSHAETYFAMWDRASDKGVPSGDAAQRAREEEAKQKIETILNKK